MKAIHDFMLTKPNQCGGRGGSNHSPALTNRQKHEAQYNSDKIKNHRRVCVCVCVQVCVQVCVRVYVCLSLPLIFLFK